MSKKILSLLVALSMLLSLAPMTLTASAAGETIDLLHNTDGSLRTGVSAMFTGTEYNGKSETYLIDGRTDSGLYFGDPNSCYIQIDLGGSRNITNIKYVVGDTSSNSWRNRRFKIEVSNDPTFTKGVTKVANIGNLASTGTAANVVADLSGNGTGVSCDTEITTSNIASATSGDTLTVCGNPQKGRYIRVTSFQKAYGENDDFLGCREIVVMGTDTDSADLIHKADGSIRNGVSVSLDGESHNNWPIDRVIDGDKTTHVYTSKIGDGNNYIQLDLGTVRNITELVYRIADDGGSNTWRNRLFKVQLSNDPTFAETSDIATVVDVGALDTNTGTPLHVKADLSGYGTGHSSATQLTDDNIAAATKGDTVTVYGTPKAYRYVRVTSFYEPGKTYLSCSEISVYGSELSYGDWAWETVGGVRTASIAMENGNSLKPAPTFNIEIVNYDAYGDETTRQTTENVSGSTLSASIPVTEADVRSVATVTLNSGSAAFLPPVGRRADPSISANAISAIIEADGDDALKAAIDDAVDMGVFTEGSLLDADIFEEEGIDAIFDDVTAILSDGDVSADELVVMLNTAEVLYALSNGDNSLYLENKELVTDNADVKSYVEDTLGYSFTASVTSTVNGATGVTNIGQIGAITFSFTEAMNPQTLTASNVVIEKSGTPISYTAYEKTADSFVIDKASLSSNSSYTVTFKAGCKTADGKKMIEDKTFSFSTGDIAAMPYKEGCAIKNVALGKTVTGTAEEGATGWADPSAAVDGVYNITSSSGETYTTDGLLFDLGDYYDVASIRAVGTDSGRPWHNTGAFITAGQTVEETTKSEAKIYEYPATNEDTLKVLDTTFSVDAGKIRYIQITPGELPLIFRELMVYAYVETDLGGAWTVPAVNGAGTYTFSKAINEYNGTNSYYMLLNAYDTNGAVTVSVVAPVSNSDDALSASITAPEGTVGISAAIVSDLTTLEQVTDPVYAGTPVASGETTTEGIKISNSGAKADMSVAKSETVEEPARVMAVVVAAPDDTTTAQTAFSSMTPAYLQSNIKFAAADVCGSGKNYTIDNLAPGKYYIVVTASNIDSEAATSYYKFTVVSEADETAKVAEFISATDLDSWVTTAVNTTEIISKDALSDADAVANDSDYYTILAYTRDMLNADNSITTLEDVKNVINAAALVDALYDADNAKAKALMPENAPLLNGKLDVNVNVDRFIDVLSKVKSNITSAETLETALDKVGMLSYMHTGTNAEKAQVLTDYATDFGIDLTLLTTYGVVIERVAEYLDATDASIYYADGTLKTAYENAVLAASAEISTGSSGVGGGSGSSGGGSSSGGVYAPPASTLTPSTGATTTPSTGTATETTTQFADMAGYSWADTAVNTLVKKGVINGYEDGTFKPEGLVTRAEFIKMLAVATEVKVVEETVMSFIDVPDGSWFFPYIRIAFTNELCNGVSEYYFNPNGLITRQDMSVMIYNYMKLTGKTTTATGKAFADAGEISAYAVEAVENAAAAGVINGYEDGTFAPKKNATRAEAAVIISRILN